MRRWSCSTTNNQRYATGSRNMFGYFLRNSTSYIYVPVQGPIILFEYPGSEHVSMWLETIDEHRVSKVVWSAVNQRDGVSSDPFGSEIADLVRTHGNGNTKVGLDRAAVNLVRSLEAEGLNAVDCMQDTLHCRRIKTPEEIACLAQSVAGTEAAVYEVEQAIKPGVTENELFAVLYGNVIRQGGEFIETRLLNSGPRTNPWFNEGERTPRSARRADRARHGHHRLPRLLLRFLAHLPRGAGPAERLSEGALPDGL